MKNTKPSVNDDFVLAKLIMYKMRRAKRRNILSTIKTRNSLPTSGELTLFSISSFHFG